MGLKVKKSKTKKKAKRYDDAEKLQLLDKYQQLRNEGKNADVAAKQIGVPYITLRTWQRNIEVKPKGKKKRATATAPARGSKPVKKGKKGKRSPAAVVLVLADGTRVECNTPMDAVKFIKANR